MHVQDLNGSEKLGTYIVTATYQPPRADVTPYPVASYTIEVVDHIPHLSVVDSNNNSSGQIFVDESKEVHAVLSLDNEEAITNGDVASSIKWSCVGPENINYDSALSAGSNDWSKTFNKPDGAPLGTYTIT
ncbi:MAG TPA: hypothetical protein DCQ87_02735, partial [Lachnospiraceae bacterium]|nr:hypothetical protein [Lachnospiraceae bacterium]